MEDAEKDQEDEKMDIQSSYSNKIAEFRQGLLQWLEKEYQPPETEDFEDGDLDALLLKVHAKSRPANFRSSHSKNNLIYSILHFNL